MLTTIRNFGHTTRGRVAAMALIVSTIVLGGNTFASATTTDPVTTAFGSLQTTLEDYLGLGVGLVITLLGLAIGVRMLVKWVRRATASS